MRLSPAGLELIKAHEGLRLNAYQDVVGVLTIGYGHTGTVKPGMTITKQEAEDILRRDVASFEKAVNDLVTAPLNQNQFDALVSFAFNLGRGALQRSTLLRKLNARDYDGAAAEFGRWINAGGKPWPGLVRRRKEERELFESPVMPDAPHHWYDELDKRL
ncbi:lysozyme [Vreelandella populi]|uniref:Lysozyme n=1 Tax=Vreelandella populi TaxID=2498858 RepID=A0A3S1E9R8_9GAMM|nr:lysozyme [Halomonas populi]RUR48814.1 lysozyme [Halomonas populi]